MLSEVFKPIIVFKTIFEIINNKKVSVEKHFERSVNYAMLNTSGRKVFIEAFETRLNDTFMHEKLKRKVTYKQAIKLDGYKLIKFMVEKSDFVPFDNEDKY